MVEIDNVEIMINQMLTHEPEAIIAILENKNPIGIMHKEDWESDRFNHIKAKCRLYKAPLFVTRSDIPIIGTTFYVDLAECERIGEKNG